MEDKKTRKRRTLEEREADLKAELAKINEIRLSRYKDRLIEAVSCLEAVTQIPGIPADLKVNINNALPGFRKHCA